MVDLFMMVGYSYIVNKGTTLQHIPSEGGLHDGLTGGKLR
jgi:hypothetical protein